MKKLLLSAFVIAAMTSCTQNAQPEPQPKPEPQELTPVSFSAAIASITPASTMSKVASNAWENSDELAIYSSEALLGDLDATNPVTPVASTAGVVYIRSAANSWAVAPDEHKWYWADVATNHTFYAYHIPGAITAAADRKAIPLPDLTGQTGKDTWTDLSEAKEFLYGTFSANKTNTIQIPMVRALSAIRFNILLKDKAFAGNSLLINSITIASVTGNTSELINKDNSTTGLAKINIEDGVITATDGPTTLTGSFNTNVNATTAETASFVILPNSGKISVAFATADGNVAAIELSAEKYDANNVYTYDVTISSKLQPVTISDPTIKAWNDITGAPITPEI